MIQIHITDREGQIHTVDAETGIGMNLMELCKAYELPVKGTCGGMALCASCHVYIESPINLDQPSEAEMDMLDMAFFVKGNSRLACQLPIMGNMDQLQISLAPESED